MRNSSAKYFFGTYKGLHFRTPDWERLETIDSFAYLGGYRFRGERQKVLRNSKAFSVHDNLKCIRCRRNITLISKGRVHDTVLPVQLNARKTHVAGEDLRRLDKIDCGCP